MLAHTKNKIAFGVVVLVIVGMVVLLSVVSPQEIVEAVGVRNGYLLAFLISLFGGFSAGGSVTFIAVIATLAVGGLNPFYLGLVSGVSLAIGDMVMFYAGTRGRALVTGRWDERIARIERAIATRPWLSRLIPVGSYLYIGFTPLPNDVLLLSLAALEYPPRKIAGIIIAGDITFALMITLLAANGVTLFI